jgi:CRP-like cAMP-binding protein
MRRPVAEGRYFAPALPGVHLSSGPLLRRLEAIGASTQAERDLLADLPGTTRHYDAHQDIVSDGDRPSVVCLMLEGMACRYKISADGKRQIVSFHIPGDIPDIQSLFIDVMDHSLAALVPSKILAIPHARMCSIIDNYPRIAHVLWRESLIDAAVFREWIVVRSRPAYVRVAHLLCEHFARMDAVGLANGKSCALPITQVQIGDALGLSDVHVNRTLQELRGENLIQLHNGMLTILDTEGLKAAGEFDARYLHVKRGMGDTRAAHG